MPDLRVAIRLEGQDAGASAAVDRISGRLGDLGSAADRSRARLGQLVDGLGRIGLAGMGFQAVAGAAQGVGNALGVGLASQLEGVSARLNAFTKDAGATEQILAQVRAEANKTPFAFAEMAQAASMLLPASRTAQGGLMGLIQQAEILAALNPSEGLEGAAFSLREALSGDFVSVMERFNIPRELINRLKDEGVPAAEITARALQEMGADMSLVGNLAATTGGRLSTFRDAIDTLRLEAGKPILAALGAQLDRLAAFLTANQEPLTRLAQTIGEALTGAIDGLAQAVAAAWPRVQQLWTQMETLYRTIQPVLTTIAERLQPVFAFLARNLHSVVIPAFVAWGAVVAAQAAAAALAMAPVLLPIAAIGAAVMLLNEAWNQNWGDIQGKTAAVWGFLSEHVFPPLSAALAFLKDTLLPALGTVWGERWAGFQTSATAVWGFLSEHVFTPLGAAYDLLTKTILPALRKQWDDDWQGMRDTLAGVWKFLSEQVFTPVGEAIALLQKTWLPNLKRDWDRDWQGMEDTLSGVWRFLSEHVFAPLGAAIGVLKDTWLPDLKKEWDRIWGEISTTADTVVKDVLGFVGNLQGGLVRAWDDINRRAGEWWTTIKDTIWNAVSPLVGLIQGAVNAIQGALNSIRVPEIRLPSIGGAPSGGSSGGAPAGRSAAEQEWADRNARENAERAHQDNIRRQQGRGAGPEVRGGDVAQGAEAAINWAFARLGQGGWAGWCQRFVENAFGTGGRYASAWSAAQSLMSNPGGSLTSVPRGMLVFFRPDPSNGGFGHVGISLGDGRMVSATNRGPEITGADAYWSRLFAGYGLPRFRWGVNNFGGGLAIVGEAGPEVVRLPRGSDVIPNHRLVPAGAGGGATYHITISLPHGTILGSSREAVARELVGAMRSELLKHGARNGGTGLLP